MKKSAWAMVLLVLTVVLAAAYPWPAWSCGGYMDHSTMGYGYMGAGYNGYGHMYGYGPAYPGYAGNYGYGNPYVPAAGQPVRTWGTAPAGQAYPVPYGYNHYH